MRFYAIDNVSFLINTNLLTLFNKKSLLNLALILNCCIFKSSRSHIRKYIMNKTELVDAIAKRSSLTKVDSKKALDAFLEAVQGALVKGDAVQLIGFGTFKVSARKARQGRNPRTGEVIKIAASKVPVFSAGSALKEAVNKKK